MGELASRGGRPHHPAHRLALGDVIRRHHRIDSGNLVLLQVGRDGVAGGGEEPARHRVHLLLLDEAAHLGQRARRLRIGILHDHLDIAARHLVTDFLPEEGKAVRHVLAGLREVAGERPEVADPDGALVGAPGRPRRPGQTGGGSTHPGEKPASTHGSLLLNA